MHFGHEDTKTEALKDERGKRGVPTRPLWDAPQMFWCRLNNYTRMNMQKRKKGLGYPRLVIIGCKESHFLLQLF